MSALRADWTPICTDLYGDADLRELGELRPVKNYPRDLPSLSETLPQMPFLYTGGLENSPDLIARLAERHPLLGNDAEVLERVRDPFFLQEVLSAAKLPMAEVRPAPANDGDRWLRKPLQGSGGGGICEWTIRDDHSQADPRFYFQRRIDGVPISAVFVATSGDTSLLGVTEQLIGMLEVHAPPFAWCGNILPHEISLGTEKLISAIGRMVAERCDLRGLFGCDFILNAETPYLIEVNPRYTGSVELIEYRHRVPLLNWHLRACITKEPSAREGFKSLVKLASKNLALSQEIACWRASHSRGDEQFYGKLIVYCDRDGIAADATQFAVENDHCWRLPQFADIPMPGSQLVAGQPLCTVFASAKSATSCRSELFKNAQSASRLLFT